VEKPRPRVSEKSPSNARLRDLTSKEEEGPDGDGNESSFQ
jgi:hypothetical protein